MIFTLFTFTSYEIRALKQISKNIPKPYKDKLNAFISNLVNILPIISNDIYPPTYTNSLKDVAKYLGFHWSNKKASGIQSIVWRYKWELTKNTVYKNKILKYNLEDCRSLIIVKKWLQSLSGNI